MTNLSKAFRIELAKRFVIGSLEVASSSTSHDGTIKYLVRLPDGETVETVLIPARGRNTLCVSTQVGCKMACSFCATGYMGFIRHLKSWEIVDQLMCLSTPAPVTNLVLMGMGEPLDNYEEVSRALKIFNHPSGFQIGKRHITLSTVGLVPEMERFAKDDLGLLAISLHGTTEAQRAKTMPINRKYPLAQIMATCRKLRFKGRTRVTFEYLLIKDLNDSPEDSRRLVKLVRGIPCKINLIAYNENPFIDLQRPSEERILAFQKILVDSHLTATYRRSRGRDVDAACGQLRTRLKPSLVGTQTGASPAL